MRGYEIAVVRDAIQILKALARAGQAIALHELAAKTRLHKSKVFRILVTLEGQGLAQREDQYWGLGDEALLLWERYRKRANHRDIEG